jgi:hypothetical protein
MTITSHLTSIAIEVGLDPAYVFASMGFREFAIHVGAVRAARTAERISMAVMVRGRVGA